MSKHTTGAWLGMLGKLVSAAGNRDASAWEQGDQVSTAHTELFNELRRMDEVQAELLEALIDAEHWVSEFVSQMNAYTISDKASESAARIRAAIAKARGES